MSRSTQAPPTVPVLLRVHLAHATAQAISDQVGADILHIKGPAVDESLRPDGRASVDADVLVRPSHFKRFLRGLELHGWQQVTTLRSGGFVEHSANWYHGELGQLDIHVRFPGIQAEAELAFDGLWRDRIRREIAGRPCDVPNLTAQRLILLLHAARALASYAPDVRLAWDKVTDTDRTRTVAVAKQLKADVALAAAIGRLDHFRDRPEYDIWRLYLDGTVTTAGFRRVVAEVRAVPDGISWPHLRVAWYSVHLLAGMPRRLASLSGSKATTREVLSAYRAFLGRTGDVLALRRNRLECDVDSTCRTRCPAAVRARLEANRAIATGRESGKMLERET